MEPLPMLPTFPPFPMPQPDTDDPARALDALFSFLHTHQPEHQELWTAAEREEFVRLSENVANAFPSV
jgi:hypothetical protein